MTDEQAEEFLPYVERTANALFGKIAGAIPREDLCGYGWIGAIRALELFDPSFGVPLRVYVIMRAKSAMLDALRDADHLSRDHRRELKKLEGETPEAFLAPVALDALPNPAAAAIELPKFSLFEDRDVIRQLLRRARLRRKVSLVVRYRYLEGLTYGQIAERMAIPHERYVCQLLEEGIKRLQRVASKTRVHRERFGPEVQGTCEWCKQGFTYRLFRWKTDGSYVLHRLRQCSQRCRASFTTSRQKLPPFEDLKRMAFKEGLTHEAIGAKFGVTRHAVQRVLRLGGVAPQAVRDVRRRMNAERIDNSIPKPTAEELGALRQAGKILPDVGVLMSLREGGLTYRQIAARYGCIYQTVIKVLQRAGKVEKQSYYRKLPPFEELKALRNAGLNNRQIAERVGCKAATVSNGLSRGEQKALRERSPRLGTSPARDLPGVTD